MFSSIALGLASIYPAKLKGTRANPNCSWVLQYPLSQPHDTKWAEQQGRKGEMFHNRPNISYHSIHCCLWVTICYNAHRMSNLLCISNLEPWLFAERQSCKNTTTHTSESKHHARRESAELSVVILACLFNLGLTTQALGLLQHFLQK